MSEGTRWSLDEAVAWKNRQPWLVGCNFIPSTAINQIEMFQGESFDPQTIQRELGWAARIGYNTVRVYLHNLLWDSDNVGFLKRLDHYLDIAYGLGIRTILVIFDDCWNTNPASGMQPKPVPGVHNSGWLQSPGTQSVNDPVNWHRLESYVAGVVRAFRDDKRILLWDLYNEPGNSNLGSASLPLLKTTFAWAREALPCQPVSAGLWFDHPELNEFQLSNSDVITFHNYNDAADLDRQIRYLASFNRPLICTEWMRRPISTFASHLSIFQKAQVGCLHWGLVAGKTQTIYPWGSPEGSPAPDVWFHDLLKPDGSPYDAAEIEIIKAHTRQNPQSPKSG